MKSAEDLFKDHCDRYTGHGWLMREHHFIKSLSEHDSEIIKEIDEMIKEKTGLMNKSTVIDEYEYQILALTELKQKLEKK